MSVSHNDKKDTDLFNKENMIKSIEVSDLKTWREIIQGIGFGLVLVYFRFRQITDNNYWFKNQYKQ